jgi:hypothetical protein
MLTNLLCKKGDNKPFKCKNPAYMIKEVKQVKQVKKIVNLVAWILVIVGGLNWGLYALDYNLVEFVFGTSVVAQIVYGLVGLSALWLLVYKLVFPKK